MIRKILLFCAFALIASAGIAGEKKKTIVDRRGSGDVQIVKYGDGSWQLLVEGKPYLIKGIEYSPDPVGRSLKESNEWMCDDFNKNTLSDGPYDAWIDANRDNFQDADEANVGDFQLLKEMGCNTIRIYHPSNIDKEILRDLYQRFGIRVIMGNFFGAYTVGSSAAWENGTDYSDPAQREAMKANVRAMVEEHKDEPYVLLWMLGNENDVVGDYANSTYNNTNAAKKPQEYAQFVGEVAGMIKELDPNHPVGVCNAQYKLISYYAKYAPEIDILGMNAYAGPFGFCTLWNRVKMTLDRPVLITEFGCDAFNAKTQAEDEAYQVQYHRRAWRDIVNNSAAGSGAGNALGGVIFCWLDKWWPCGSNKTHDTEIGGWKGPTNDGIFQDEWLGICSQGDATRSPFIRQPRKVYYLYKDELWNQQ